MSTQRVTVGLTIVNLLLLAFIVVDGLRLPAIAAAASSAQASGVTPELPILRGRALEIVDDEGQIRSRLNVEANGDVLLRMTDRNGTIRVKFGAGEGGSALLLLDDATEPAVHLVARRSGTQERPTTTSLTLRAGNQQRVISP